MYAHGRGLQLKNRRKRSKKLGRREEVRGDGKRKSKDKVENAERKRLMEWIEENGWEVLKRNKEEDGEEKSIGGDRFTEQDVKKMAVELKEVHN
jgi:hypothetical protein